MSDLKRHVLGLMFGITIGLLTWSLFAVTVTPPTPEGRAGARASVTTSIAIHTAVGSADTLDLRGYASAQIKIPASVTAIAFYTCDTADGTFTPLHESSGTASSIGTLTAADWYNFPAAAVAAGFVRIVSTGATGTATVVLKT